MDMDILCKNEQNCKVIEDKQPSQVIKEGKAEILLSSSKNVFYNPVQEFNRDLSVAVLTLCATDHYNAIVENKKRLQQINDNRGENDDGNAILTAEDQNEDGVTVLEALSATGLRSIRYAKEVPGIKHIIANDISETAVNSIQMNVLHNEVGHLITTSHDDAVMLMYKHRRPSKRFNVVDLDPYGCPSQFLDTAVQCVSDGGVLLVTCTDMAVLAGNSPETCYTKYGAISLKNKACHEMALRIVLQCIESHANRYGRYIVPLLSVSADFYVRVFIKVFSGPATCKRTTSKLSLVYQCVGCETLTLQPLGTSKQYGEKPNQYKFSLPHGPPVGALCDHCNHKHHIGGPIWSGPIHDENFVTRLEHLTSQNQFGTSRRLQGVLAVIREELLDVPLYYTLDRLCSVLHCETLPMLQFRSALLNTGYRVSYSHASRTSIKTDAPSQVVWDILRHWQKEHPIRADRLQGPALAILSKQPTTDIDMTLRQDANPCSRKRGLARFQENPVSHWGPGTRAKTSTHGDDKMTKSKQNQGKRNHSKSNSSPQEESNKVMKLDQD